MQKTIFVKATEQPIKELAVKPKPKTVTLEVTLEDEIYDPGHEFVTFSLDNRLIYRTSKFDLENPTALSWKYSGYSIAESQIGPWYNIESSDFEGALEELGITISNL